MILACLAALVGLLFAAQATLGVGILAAAYLLAIFARMAQADHHHNEVKRMIRAQWEAAGQARAPDQAGPVR